MLKMERKRDEAGESGGEEMDDEDTTCCHRVTVCHPLIREIAVTEPISECLERLGVQLSWANGFEVATTVGLSLMGWAVLYFLFGDAMLPGNHGFGFYFLVILSSWLGSGLSSIPYLNLPPVFGMLLAGFVVRNTGLYHVRETLGTATTSIVKTICLTLVMIRAGLQLSASSLKRHPFFLTALALVPCTTEAAIVAVCCKYLLAYPWDWSVMTGTNICCISPVVTINCVFGLLEQGYGDDEGLATILCTAACIESVHALSLFSVCYSIVFADDRGRMEWRRYLPPGLRDAVIGTLAGLLLGVGFVFFPHRSHRYATAYRMICLVLGSLMCTTAAAKLSISGAGYLASLVLSFVAMLGWKILTSDFDAAHFLSQIGQPILVGIIGADIEFAHWSPDRFYLHLLCILVGLLTRSAAAYSLTLRTTFTTRERLFILVCWLPKGTLQAALGPMAYERLQTREDQHQIETALDIVRLSVVSIVFMAPIGAALISRAGPLLLRKLTDEERQRDRQLSYLQILALLPQLPKKPARAGQTRA